MSYLSRRACTPLTPALSPAKPGERGKTDDGRTWPWLSCHGAPVPRWLTIVPVPPACDTGPRLRRRPMKTYRVAVIGRTGKGNYGHGLDIVWLRRSTTSRSSPSPTRTRRAAPPPPSASAPKNAYADYREMLDEGEAADRQRRRPLPRPAPRHGRRLRRGRGEHLPRKADGPHARRGRRDGRRLREAPRQARHRPPDALQPAAAARQGADRRRQARRPARAARPRQGGQPRRRRRT